MIEYRHGALTVMENRRIPAEVDRELKEIDPRLFVERQITLENEAVWCAVIELGDRPPVTIHEFRGPKGEPIPDLTSRFVQEVKAMRGDGANLTAEVIRRNQELLERRQREAQQSYQDLADDIVYLLDPKRSGVLHRGPHLRRTRDRMRSQGWKV